MFVVKSEHSHLMLVAEKDIAKRLKQLEIETNMIVDSLALQNAEITKMDDDRRQLLRRVIIEMHRLPGSNWE